MTTEEKCWLLTPDFEGNGYAGLTGDFDGQGWSYGILSWACGEGTLQPLIKSFYDNGPATFQRCCTVPVNGTVTDLSPDLLAWLKMPVAEATQWAAARCETEGNRQPLAHWLQVFKNLGEVPEYQALQREAGASYMAVAHSICRDLGFVTERGLALAFDIAVQDGSVRPEAKAAYKAAGSEQDRLISLAHAVAKASRYPADVLSRKMTIATGSGVVHDKYYNLAAWPGLTLGPIQ